MLDPIGYLDSTSLRDFVVAASSEPLPWEHDDELAEAVRRGEPGAAETLVRLHLRDVVDEAIRHRGDVGVQVLIRTGVRELVAAARRYHPDRDGAFAAYARANVRPAVRAAALGS